MSYFEGFEDMVRGGEYWLIMGRYPILPARVHLHPLMAYARTALLGRPTPAGRHALAGQKGEGMNNEERYSPFHCGTQEAGWTSGNCSDCANYTLPDDWNPEHSPTCEIDMALTSACFGDGTVSEEIARRMGFLHEDGTTEALALGWWCPEREVKP